MALKSLAIFATGLTIGLGITFASSQQERQTLGDFPDLVKGLKEIPGCLDVKVGRLGNQGEQQTIFAWFKDKAAVKAWYSSPMHVGAMRKFFPNLPGHGEVLPKFKDTDGPWLVVASVTPGDKPVMRGSNLHVAQIAIEMYRPTGGGLAIGGSFGPKSLGDQGPNWIPTD